jgi:hypothetical protein
MTTAAQKRKAVCEHLGIDPKSVVKFREEGGDYIVLWDEGIGGMKKRRVGMEDVVVAVPKKAAPKKRPPRRGSNVKPTV